MGLVLLNLQSNQQIKLENHLPVIIGRGNVEGCTDKRVSRNHGRITCTVDGKIHIVALHSNPCFITRNGLPPVVQLNKNEEETLNKGDCLGLLPDAFWFQITSDHDLKLQKKVLKSEPARLEENAGENFGSIVLQENGGPSDVERVDSDNDGYKSVAKENSCFLKKRMVESVDFVKSSPQPSTSSVISTQTPVYPELEKTKKLPLWMYEIDEPKNSFMNLNKRELENRDDSGRKRAKVSSAAEVQKETDICEVKIEVDEVCQLPSTSTKDQDRSEDNQKRKEGYESGVNLDNMQGNTERRPYCQYEGKCYRKNPQHKQDFCHPGDEDYLPYKERPLCQYGAGCYRRNMCHRLQFRHPPAHSNTRNASSASSCSCSPLASTPAPAKRRRKKVKRQNCDYEDEEVYDSDEPFIDDCSSDEYLPSESVSEAEEFDSFQDDH